MTPITAIFKLDVYISMTASDNSVINWTMKLIFTIKMLKHYILNLHSKAAINIGGNRIYRFTIYALLSSRYRLLVRSIDIYTK